MAESIARGRRVAGASSYIIGTVDTISRFLCQKCTWTFIDPYVDPFSVSKSAALFQSPLLCLHYTSLDRVLRGPWLS